MVLDSKIKAIREAFSIETLDQWALIKPDWILELHGVGPETLNHVRLYLAARGRTLRDDQTPAYWQQHLSKSKIGGSLTDDDNAVVSPFTILIDEQEKLPFTFEGHRADADQEHRPLIIQTEVKHLGPTHGDYSLKGYEGQCHVERKSCDDAISTFLAEPGGERAERWKRTMAFLAEIATGAVVIECTIGQMLASVEARGKRSKAALMKSLFRQVLAWQDDYRIPFHFCDDRPLAEKTTLAIFRRFHRKSTQTRQAAFIEPDTVHDFL